MKFRKFITSSLLAATIITSLSPPNAYAFHLSSDDRRYISDFLQNHFSYDELIEFIHEIERGDNLEDKYSHEELTEIKEFLSYLAHLGTLTRDEKAHSELNEKILELLTPEEGEYEECEEYQGSTNSVPEWYHQVYFPNQLPNQEITLCKSILKKAASNTWYYGKKYVKKAYKETGKGIDKAVDFGANVGKGVGKGIEEVGKGAKKIYKKITGKSKKGWEKTKKFVQENKKAILIGLAVVAVVTVAIIYAPEIASLLAALIPATTDDKKDTQLAQSSDQAYQVQSDSNQSLEETVQAVSYTEENLFEDCIEIVQDGLLASGINNIIVEEAGLVKALDTVKCIGSHVCHELIDVLDKTINFHDVIGQLQNFDNTNIDPKKLEEIHSSFEKLKYKFNAQIQDISQRDGSNSQRFTDYLHARTDQIFDTPQGTETYFSQKNRIPGQVILEVPRPIPGKMPGSLGGNNQLRKFTENNYRKNLKKTNPHSDYALVDAHHVFPKCLKRDFERFGINVHDPQYLTWWEKSEHRKLWHEYESAWKEFFRKNPNTNKEQILNFGKKLMDRYGIETLY